MLLPILDVKFSRTAVVRIVVKKTLHYHYCYCQKQNKKYVCSFLSRASCRPLRALCNRHSFLLFIGQGILIDIRDTENMNKEQDYASDSDESDEDFRPDDLAGESAVSEEEAEGSDENDELVEHTEEIKKKPVKRKSLNKKVSRKKAKADQDDESEDDNINTSRRATRQTDDALANGKGKSLEKDELLSDEEDKSRTNALWADFLKDVSPRESMNTCTAENKPSSSRQNGKEQINGQKESSAKQTVKVETNKTVVTEVLDFAGEEVSIEREIDASSVKENKAATIPAAKKQPFGRIMPGATLKRTVPTAASGSGPGLGSILNQLGKKKKLSVLEKSQLDWKSFKQSEGIDEQLQTFNKGKDG